MHPLDLEISRERYCQSCTQHADQEFGSHADGVKLLSARIRPPVVRVPKETRVEDQCGRCNLTEMR